jgi:hypothetical protein
MDKFATNLLDREKSSCRGWFDPVRRRNPKSKLETAVLGG